MRFKVFTRIQGGLIGARSAYMKDREGKELVFETREDAERCIAESKRTLSRYGSYRQYYEVHEVEG